jgi:hypothetical protein
MRQGEVPDDLPSIETFECRVCNVSVKYLREHLKNVHKITEAEYEELFKDEMIKTENKNNGTNIKREGHQDIIDINNMQPAAVDKQTMSKNGPTAQTGTNETMPDYLAVDSNLPKPPKSDIQDNSTSSAPMAQMQVENIDTVEINQSVVMLSGTKKHRQDMAKGKQNKFDWDSAVSGILATKSDQVGAGYKIKTLKKKLIKMYCDQVTDATPENVDAKVSKRLSRLQSKYNVSSDGKRIKISQNIFEFSTTILNSQIQINRTSIAMIFTTYS